MWPYRPALSCSPSLRLSVSPSLRLSVSVFLCVSLCLNRFESVSHLFPPSFPSSSSRSTHITGAKHVFGIGVLATAVLTLLIPVTACNGDWICPVRYANTFSSNETALITPASTTSIEVLRVFMGVFESVTYPALMALLAKWAPPAERSRIVALCFSGAQIGTAVAFPLAAYISTSGAGAGHNNSLVSGWPGVFYVFGGIGCVWFVGWCLFVYSSPEDHPRISAAEREYIVSRLPKNDQDQGDDRVRANGNNTRKMPLGTFLRNVFTNLPALAVFVAHFTNNWALYLMLTWMPNYMEKMLDFDLKSSGLCFVPYAAMGALSIGAGALADALILRRGWRPRHARLLMQLSGNLLPAAAFVVLGFVTDKWVAFGVMIVAVASSGMSYSGYSPNVLEICPRYAGLFYGVSNTLATIPGIVAPALAGEMVGTPPTRGEWQGVFAIAAGMYVVGDVFYVCFASSEPQESLGGGGGGGQKSKVVAGKMKRVQEGGVDYQALGDNAGDAL
jgi:ACS family sodium-dependent inorganic phosphate cotransporter-like MFS transporter 5